MSLGDRMGILGAILALIALAVTILWPDRKWVGWISLAGAVALLLGWGWLEFGRDLPRLRLQYPIISGLAVFMMGGCLAAVLWRLVVSTTLPVVPLKTPSLVFVFGAPLGDNESSTWLMMLRHYGPNSAYNCQIEFFDDDRKNIEHQWLVNHPNTPFLPAGLFDKSQLGLYVLEAEPEGPHQNFKWSPVDPDHQHYTVSISCRDGVFVEKWEVTRVAGVLRAKVIIERGPAWIEKNPNLDPVVFRCEDPEFMSSPLLATTVTPQHAKKVHPGWKPNHVFAVPVAIIDPNGHVQIVAGVKQPDGTTRTDFGCWNILTKHFGDAPSNQP